MKCTLYASRNFVKGTVDKRLFSSFVEQLGRAVYGGVYEPEHPLADEDGLRTDVMTLIRELDVPMVRFPGGNYVSNHNWEDSVGPKETRPTRLDLAWKALDPNQFGIHEFVQWAKKVGTEPMMAINLGTRGLAEAKDLIEYCNHPEGSTLSDLRTSHASKEPYDIQMWCLGNEMDGPWQVGHKTAEEYGRLANEVGKAIKLFDPALELVACGSSNAQMPTFPQWEETVLDHCYDVADYISLHLYLRKDDDDTATFLASSMEMDSFIESVIHVCDYVKAKKRSKKTMYLSFDEWNVWYHSNQKDKEQPAWIVGPSLLEDVYTFEDALVVGCMLNSLLRHCDRVKVACLAQLVNTIAPIMTETGGSSWRQTIYWPFYYASRYGRGEVLDSRLSVPTYENTKHGSVPYADSVAVYHPEIQELDIFVINRNQKKPLEMSFDLSGFGKTVTVLEHITLAHADVSAVNDRDNPDEVFPEIMTTNEKRESGSYSATFGELTWNLLRLSFA